MDHCTSNKELDNITLALSQFAENIKQYALPFEIFHNSIEQIRPILESVVSISTVYRTADKIADNQFVLFERIPRELINRAENEDINDLISEMLISYDQVEHTITKCNFDNNRLFRQSIDAFNNNSYDLAIIGLTAVLDMILSNQSNQIRNVNIASRCNAITQKIKDRGELYIDELEGQDFLLFLTYPKAIELFGESKDFTEEEPALLNRHWIMHGRTMKQYNRLDCVKVLNMIYGTIRMGQLGKQDG